MARSFVLQRNIISLMVLALLAACAGSRPEISNTQEAVHYQEVAKNNYNPPGTAADPWGPYIYEAAARFDVPARWIRQVMMMESGGNEYMNGQLTTSVTGAMGLMQVEPETYDELRVKYSLGTDPYNPHDNILAGTAYLRELYNQFGSPGFLAAYNAGPGRLNGYLAGRNALPDETRHYVAMIGPELGTETPLNPSPNDGLAYNELPMDVPPGRRRRGEAIELASNSYDPNAAYDPDAAYSTRQGRSLVPAVSRSNLAPPIPPAPPAEEVAYNQPHHSIGLSLISIAYADELPEQDIRGGSKNWGIQVGAYSNRALARAATQAARQEAPVRLARAVMVIGSVSHGSRTMYRARLAGLTREQAQDACERLRARTSCMVVSPDSST